MRPLQDTDNRLRDYDRLSNSRTSSPTVQKLIHCPKHAIRVEHGLQIVHKAQVAASLT